MSLAAVLLVLLCAAAGWLRVRKYRQWFALPAHRTDRFECRGNHQVIPVRLQPDGFDAPAGVVLRGRTVFVYMSVSPSILGYLLDPYIEMRLETNTLRQYFERGCRGSRYLNLTHLAGDEEPRRFELRGRMLHWRSEASLLIFESPELDTANVLVLAPHPDDAEAAAFGMYSQREARVVTITAGERATGTMPDWLSEPSRTYWTAKLRVADSLGPGSALEHITLVFPDSALEAMHREPAKAQHLGCEAALPRATLRAANGASAFQMATPDCRWADLVADLRRVLQLQPPGIIICPHPLLDGHPDHVFTAVALEEALRGFQAKPPVLLLYVVHSREAPLYPLGPMPSVVGLPPGCHAQWMTDSIYSHRLDARTREAKYFALGAMHAVRSHTGMKPQSAWSFLRVMKQAAAAFVAGLAVHPASLLRRACRPDELFYVVSVTEFRELVARVPHATT